MRGTLDKPWALRKKEASVEDLVTVSVGGPAHVPAIRVGYRLRPPLPSTHCAGAVQSLSAT